MSDCDFDVVISGYGPTGQAAASLLSRLGHSVCVFERWPTLYGLPRLCTLDGEAARIVQAAGDIDVALQNSNANKRYELLNEADEKLMILDWDLDHISGFPYRIAMYQPDIEDAMHAQAIEFGAEINQGWQVTGVSQSDDAVEVTAQATVPDPESKDLSLVEGEERRVTARYVIGADGARSAIRDSLGIEREDFHYRNAWLSLDATRKRVPLPTLHGAEDLRTAFVICAPEGRTRAVIPIGSDRLRFEFLVDPETDHTEDLDPAVGYRYLKEAYDLTEDDVELYRSVIYPFEGQLAEEWRRGRVFIGGDAAHLMTPFLGQGACAALRDAANLSWKLDLVLRGVSGDALLDTYQQERRPHVKLHVVVSNEIGKMACEPDPEIAAKRDEMLLSGNAPPPAPDPYVETGVLHLEGAERAELPIGDVGPQALVSFEGTEGRFDDVFGWGFQLIGLDFDPAGQLDQPSLEFLAEVHGITAGVAAEEGDGLAADLTGNYRRFFEQHGAVALLLRPDFVIFGLASSPAEVQSLVDDLREQLTGSGKLSGAASV